MTPANIIKPYLIEADRQRPELKRINTALSCYELLALALKLAGPDWAFVGKTRDKDGASITPQGFAPITMTLTRNDSQLETVTIVGVSQDAAFHIPTRRQVKVIGNSSANDDPRPEIHGPANLNSYDIPAHDYRWHNPIIPQTLVGQIPDTPAPQVPQPPPPAVVRLGRDEYLEVCEKLHAFYKAPEGLQREKGLWRDDKNAPDFEGIAAWVLDVYAVARFGGKSKDAAWQEVVTNIRNSNEWKGKHP